MVLKRKKIPLQVLPGFVRQDRTYKKYLKILPKVRKMALTLKMLLRTLTIRYVGNLVRVRISLCY